MGSVIKVGGFLKSKWLIEILMKHLDSIIQVKIKEFMDWNMYLLLLLKIYNNFIKNKLKHKWKIQIIFWIQDIDLFFRTKSLYINLKMVIKIFEEQIVHFFLEEKIFYLLNLILNKMVIIIKLSNLTNQVMILIILTLLTTNRILVKVISNNRDFSNYLVIKVSFSLEDSVLMKIIKKK